MTTPRSPVQSVSPATRTACRAGHWLVQHGRALSLRPTAMRRLVLAQGRAWVTLSGVDHVLQAGEALDVPAGSHLVLEAWPHPGGPTQPLWFDWCEPPVSTACLPAGRFQIEVAQPAREACQALAQAACALARAAWALWRAAWGLVAYSDHLVAGRGRVLTPLESCRS